MKIDDDDMSEDQLNALIKVMKEIENAPQSVEAVGTPCDYCHGKHGTIAHLPIVMTDGTVINATLHENCIDAFIDVLEESRKHPS